MGRTVCKTVPCYILSLIRGTAITSRWSVTVGSRQLFSIDIPRASPSVTTASLSIAITSLRSVGPRDKSPGWSVGPRTSLRLVVAYSLLFSNMLQRKCLFSVYRLAVDAKPVG